MNAITKFSIKNAIVIALAIIFVCVGGYYSANQTNKENMPNISIPMVKVSTVYPGANPDEIAKEVSRPIQKSLNGIEGISHVKTYSFENVSIVIAEFKDSKDIKAAETEVNAAVAGIKFNDKVQKSKTQKAGFGMFPIITYSLKANTTEDELTRIMKDKIIPELNSVNGVSTLDVQGLASKKVNIKLDNDKLKKYGLTILDVKNALLANEVSIPLGQINNNDETMGVKVAEEINSIEELKEVPIILYPSEVDMAKQFSRGMNSLAKGMQELGGVVKALSDGTKAMGDSLKTLAKVSANNTQAISFIAQLQKEQADLLKAKDELTNSKTIAASESMKKTLESILTKFGSLIGVNTQEIAMIGYIENFQTEILKAQEVLVEDKSSTADKQTAAIKINTLNTELSKLLSQLSELTNKNILDAKAIEAELKMTNVPSDKALTKAETEAYNKIVLASKNMLKLSSELQKNMFNTKELLTKLQNGAKKSSVAISTSSKSSTEAPSNALSIKTIKLKELASIAYEKNTESLFTRSNLKNSIILNFYKTDDGNTIEISDSLRKKITEINKKYKSITFTEIQDSANAIKKSVEDLVKEGLLGALFAVIVIALFLRDIRATIIAIVSIPLSIFIALITLPLFGITINTMSLAGISVAVGRIVDDSIVVIENIYRRFQGSSHLTKEERLKLLIEATGEVGSAITSSTITTVAVFLPLGFVSGVVGKIFTSFAITVVICIIASLLIAVTVVPLMSKFMLLNKTFKNHEGEKKGQKLYKRTLSWSLSNRGIVFGIATVIVVASVFMANSLGVQFLPASESKTLNVKLKMKLGTSSETVNKTAIKLEKYILSNKNVETVLASIGDNSNTEGGKMSIQMTSEASFTVIIKADIKETVEALRNGFEKYETKDIKITAAQKSETGASENLELMVTGNSIQDIKKAADLITENIRGVESLANVSNNLSEDKWQVMVKLDKLKAANKGLNQAMVAGLVRTALNYDKVMTMKKGNENIDIALGIKQVDLSNIEKLKSLKINSATGLIELKTIADIEMVKTPVSISEEDGEQYAAITGDITGGDTQKVSDEAIAKIDNIKAQLPEGIAYSLRGSSKSISEGFAQMKLAVITAIFAVFIILIIVFGELAMALAILATLPFAAVGGILGLFVASEPITMTALIGMLMLIGIVVTNAIVFLDRAQKNMKKGIETKEALLEAGAIRLRPILMTAIATISALIPTAFGMSGGENSSRALSIVVIGGLSISTILTLVIVPITYSVFDDLRKKFVKK